ncbi:VOC family protein [Corallococcus exercitus]|uniref:VOC family protein n=1 Tax=Corallococcus exercitus TaxID=2316736 RepID=A0A7Y4NHW5_9BACT|nr:VOC family protein [Corallococcus exercitus]NOK14051.1 VOC family protein [Corallococcus exercitus]
MIDHLSFYATDFAASKAFYEAVLPSLGAGLVMEMTATWDAEFPTRRMAAFGPPQRPVLWLIETKTPASPRHVAFTASGPEAVDGFHQAALKAGGKDNGAPGKRPHYHAGYYGAFVLDPDGNNVEAVHHGAP